MDETTETTVVRHVMNECVIDCDSHLRGLCTLETVRINSRIVAPTCPRPPVCLAACTMEWNGLYMYVHNAACGLICRLSTATMLLPYMVMD